MLKLDLLLRNACIAEGPALLDIAVHEGIIQACGADLPHVAQDEIDLAGRLVIPGFVESHVHLDIALTDSQRIPGRRAPYRSTGETNELVEQQRRAFTEADIKQRAGEAVRMASRHGVVALRAQCHVDSEVGLSHLEALLAVREANAERVTLQIVAFPQKGLVTDRKAGELLRESARLGANAIGGAANLEDSTGSDGIWRAHIDAVLQLAMELDVDVDIHVDHELPEAVRLDQLEVVYLAQRVIERGYQGRVVAGHLCALDSASPSVVDRAVDVIKEADLNVVLLPDLLRLGRNDQCRVRRGLPPVKKLLEAGVNLAYASNNVRDWWRPLGNLDPLEEGLILAYGAHLDSRAELGQIMRMGTYNGARALGLDGYGLANGCWADLVVLEAPSPSAAIVGQAEKRLVLKKGRLVTRNCRSSDLVPQRPFSEALSDWTSPR